MSPETAVLLYSCGCGPRTLRGFRCGEIFTTDQRPGTYGSGPRLVAVLSQFRKSFRFLERLGWRAVVAGCAFLASAGRRRLPRSAAPPLPTGPACAGLPRGPRNCAQCLTASKKNQFRKSFSFLERLGWRSFLRALASIWRIRSRVTLNSLPTSSRVQVRPSSMPGAAEHLLLLGVRVPSVHQLLLEQE